ncbi:rhodanese-like domain-containing protein [Hydrogenophaga sp. BPS33]|uniref:rhodanese-like domain-containing protein n=1 Tax=Hydrogenophaga sp. BPS33 TaxID=2651974 RepID=UPI00131FBB46|nr:rhodanese-like domain-containing protein [Hydrogenophaga sp. BPS33]QHE84480.1 rhodanese-related sulfurtransferase [Hydrogenophaga sp. BPS33]
MPVISVSAFQLRDMLLDGGEIAVLDIRDEGLHTEGHLLLAASLPLSRLALDGGWRVPRRGTRVVLVDDAAARIAQAADLLAKAGYTQVFALDNFHTDGEAAGLGIFSGKYVPSKAFGEVVETRKHTPQLDTAALQALWAQTPDLLVVDSRTPQEFQQFSLPGAHSCPGAELLLRVPEALGSNGVVLVNCAGRTRSIIGAQSLINAGIAARVYAVENGTMGWHLQGLALDHGKTRMLAPARKPEQIAWGRQRALALLERTGGRVIDWAQLQALKSDPNATTYFYDVRLNADYQRGALPGARNAPGGELVQSTDHFAPVRHARIVLTDTDLVQAPMTAHWLRQMGWQADVLDPSTAPALLPAQPDHAAWLQMPAPVQSVTVPWLEAALRDGSPVAVIDCGSSIEYRHGHIPGAWYSMRSALPASLNALPMPGTTLVFTAHDEALAHFAAADAQAAGHDVRVLTGGTGAWRAQGLALETGAPRLLSPTTDVWYSPYEVEPEQQEAAMRAYISWETGLTQRIAGEPGVHFNVL